MSHLFFPYESFIVTVEDIIDDLSVFVHGMFPKEALQEAINKQEAITPVLLAHLEKQAANIEQTAKEQNMLDIYAVFLLAQFREPGILPLIIKLVSEPDDTAAVILGDETVHEDLKRIWLRCLTVIRLLLKAP